MEPRKNQRFLLRSALYVAILIVISTSFSFADITINETFDNLSNFEVHSGVSLSEGAVIPSSYMEGAPVADDSTVLLSHLDYDSDQAVDSYITNTITDLDNGKVWRNTVFSEDGVFGKAIRFDGNAGIHYENCLYTTTEIREKGLTVSAWFNFSNVTVTSSQTIVSCGLNSNTGLYVRNGKLMSNIRINNNTSNLTLTGTTNVTPNEWHHAILTYDPSVSQIKIYLDGIKEAESSAGLSNIGVVGEIITHRIGNSVQATYSYANGVIDEALIKTRVTNDPEALSMYQKRIYQNEMISKPFSLESTYNTVTCQIDETSPGATEVYILSNNKWHRIYPNIPLPIDSTEAPPINELIYKIKLVGNTELRSISFTASNETYASDDGNVSFVCWSDVASGLTGALKRAVNTIARDYPNIDFILSAGDTEPTRIVNNVMKVAAEQLNRPVKGMFPWFPAVGNHDIETVEDMRVFVEKIGPRLQKALPGIKNFKEGPYHTFSNGYADRLTTYSFDYKNVHIIIVNQYYLDEHNRFETSYGPLAGIREELHQWIKSDLEETSQPVKFVVGHEPAYPPAGTNHYGDSLDDSRYPGNSGPSNTRPMRDKFWSIMAQHGVIAHLSGHNHAFYFDYHSDPLLGGRGLYEVDSGACYNYPGFVFIQVAGNTVTMQQFSVDTTDSSYPINSKSDPFVIDISGGNNHPPTFKNVDSLVVEEDQNISYGFEAYDVDFNDTLTFSAENLPPNTTFRDFGSLDRKCYLDFQTVSGNAGNYVVRLKVSDQYNASAILDVPIEIKPADAPVFTGSIPSAGYTYGEVKSVRINFSDNIGLNSHATQERTAVYKDGVVFREYWPNERNLTGFTIMFNNSFAPEGQYEIVVNDPVDIAGHVGEDVSISFQVQAGFNNPPTALIHTENAILPVGGILNVSALGSSDIDGNIVSYTWNFGDGSDPVTTTTETAEHCFLSAGNYTTTVTATDNKGGTGEASLTVTVKTSGNIYYVSPIGNDSWSGMSSESNLDGTDGPFATFSKACTIAQAGDTVLIRGGIYQQTLIPTKSGAPLLPIIFKNFNNEEVIIRDVNSYDERALSHPDDPNPYYGPIWIEDKSYLVFDGLKVTNTRGYVRAVRANHVDFKNCHFYGALDGWIIGMHFFESNDNSITNCIIEEASDNVRMICSNRNRIENNQFYKARHVLLTLKGCNNNIIRNNYFYNEWQKIMEVYDCEQPTMFDHHNIPYHRDEVVSDSTKYNLIEKNVFAYTAIDRIRQGGSTPEGPFNGIQYAGQNGIIRNNIFYNNNGGGLALTVYGDEAEHNTHNRVYNNVFYSNHFAGLEIGSGNFEFTDNIIMNNIFFKNDFVNPDHVYDIWGWANASGRPLQICTKRTTGGYLFLNNNIYNVSDNENHIIAHPDDYEDGVPGDRSVQYWQYNYPGMFGPNVQADPGFVDAVNYNFHLTSSSQMIDAGTFLTTATSTGSGINLPVADSLSFFDGNGIENEEGDLIKISNGQTARILSINHDTKILTLDRSVSWTSGDGVDRDYNGTKPDIGAFEFSSGSTNEPPVISSLAAINRYEGELIQFDIIVYDETEGDVITLSYSALPIGATLIKTAEKTWQFRWQTNFTSSGNNTIAFTASDGNADSEPVSVNIIVNDVNTSVDMSNKPDWFKT